METMNAVPIRRAYLSVTEAAEILAVSREAIAKMIEAGRLPTSRAQGASGPHLLAYSSVEMAVRDRLADDACALQRARRRLSAAAYLDCMSFRELLDEEVLQLVAIMSADLGAGIWEIQGVARWLRSRGHAADTTHIISRLRLTTWSAVVARAQRDEDSAEGRSS